MRVTVSDLDKGSKVRIAGFVREACLGMYGTVPSSRIEIEHAITDDVLNEIRHSIVEYYATYFGNDLTISLSAAECTEIYRSSSR